MRFPFVFPWSVLRNTVAVGALAGLTMCANIDNIDVDAGGKATIPAATLVDKLLGSVAFAGFDTVDFSEEFQNQGVTKKQVDSVHVKSMTLTIDAPASGSFDFLQSLHFFAKADGLDKIEIATLDSIPKGKTRLDLIVDASAELKPYVTAASMQILSEVQGSRPDQETTVTAAVVLDVDVHIPGCN